MPVHASPLAGEGYELPSISHTTSDSVLPSYITTNARASGSGSGTIKSPPVERTHKRTPSGRRTLTIHTGASTSAIVFNAPSLARDDRSGSVSAFGIGSSAAGGGTTSRRRSTRSDASGRTGDPNTPRPDEGQPKRSRSFFLHEDPSPHSHHHSHPYAQPETETHSIPDFSNLLGFSSEGPEGDNYDRARLIGSDWKRRLFLLMEEPGSSNEGFVVHVGVTCGILFSALLTILSTLPSFHTNPVSVKLLFGLDTMIVVLFTVEYFARLLAHSDSWKMCWKWATTFFAIVDILAILPFYIEIALREDTTTLFRFSILRTLRLLRVFRAFKYQNQMLFTIEVMYIAIRKSESALLALAFFILMALVIFSTLIYFAERGTWDDSLLTFVNADGAPSQFESIPSAAWFVLVTITTVGYGDIVPRSILGKVLTVPLLVFGLLLIALPSFVLGRNFAIVFDAMQSQLNAVGGASNAPSPRTSIDARPSASNGYPAHRAGSPSLPLPATSKGTRPENGKQKERMDGMKEDNEDEEEEEDDEDDEVDLHGAPHISSAFGRNVVGGNEYGALPMGNLKPAKQGPGMLPDDLKPGALAKATSSGSRSNTPQPKRPQAQAGAAAAADSAKGDLTNTKLAMNQLVLMEEIETLRGVTERQNEMMEKMMGMLAGLTAVTADGRLEAKKTE